MISIQTYVRKGRSVLRRWLLEPAAHTALHIGAYALSGMCLSAASLGGRPMPLALSLVCASSGWRAVASAAGAALGFLLFWKANAMQALLWLAMGTSAAVILGFWPAVKQMPLLLPAVSSLIVALCGVIFHDGAQQLELFVVYVIRVVAAFFGTWLFSLVKQRRNPILDWLACGVMVFALAQIMPIPYLGLGYLAAGALTVGASFPAAALAGLALDLAGITAVPMTAVVTLSYLVRFLPRPPVWLGRLTPAVVYIGIMCLGKRLDLYPLPGLLLGGLLGSFLPRSSGFAHRRGPTGVVQVRLEVAAGVLSQTQQLLLEVPPVSVDEDALVQRAAQQACGGCPYRKSCKDCRRLVQLSGMLLHKPLQQPDELPIVCRKSGRLLRELQRGQERLRMILGDRQRQAEYREAVIQQYRFLSEFLQELSDGLLSRSAPYVQIYTPRVEVYGNRPEADNGDKCLRFSGIGGKYYVLLCDGMGTGMGAIQESRLAGSLLKRMLCAGFPAAHALRSLNALCALRSRAGAVTVDLAEICLDSGKTMLYKWGAAPSYLISRGGAERIGTTQAPPGVAVDQQETTHRLTLRRNQLLVLASDGVPQEAALHSCMEAAGEPPGEVAARLLAGSYGGSADDATVVMVCLTEQER